MTEIWDLWKNPVGASSPEHRKGHQGEQALPKHDCKSSSRVLCRSNLNPLPQNCSNFYILQYLSIIFATNFVAVDQMHAPEL